MNLPETYDRYLGSRAWPAILIFQFVKVPVIDIEKIQYSYRPGSGGIFPVKSVGQESGIDVISTDKALQPFTTILLVRKVEVSSIARIAGLRVVMETRI